MGERFGPNTLAAFHAGADAMTAKLAEEAQRLSADQRRLEKGESGDVMAGPTTTGGDDFDDDFDDFDDDEVLARFREARLAELRGATSRAASSSAEGDEAGRRERESSGFLRIRAADWRREVVDASAERWCVVHLDSGVNAYCAALLPALDALGKQHAAVAKFVTIDAEEAMPGAGIDKLLPALFFYKRGKLETRLIGLELVEDRKVPTTAVLEWKLNLLGVLDPFDDDDGVGGDDDDDDDR